MSFSFGFAGDDIDGDVDAGNTDNTGSNTAGVASPATAPPATSFPVQGKPQLPPQRHDLRAMLASLPSKIAYGLLNVQLDGAASSLRLPRRELWDVRVQLMAEEELRDAGMPTAETSAEALAHGPQELAPGLGTHDVKTGIYEGGFKSWESSVDLVKVLLDSPAAPSTTAASVLLQSAPAHVIELGCGTALPSMALFQWACAAATVAEAAPPSARSRPLLFTMADYNPSVLYLVTLPNFLLAWALQQYQAGNPLLQAAVAEEDGGGGGELELSDEVKAAFVDFLDTAAIKLSFLSGGWSSAFTDLLYTDASADAGSGGGRIHTLVLGAETIYSPFALEAFSETLMTILRREEERGSGDGGGDSSLAAVAIVGAKKLYFGVGGSLDDFVQRMRVSGAAVQEIREETDGVRRGVVQCLLAQ